MVGSVAALVAASEEGPAWLGFLILFGVPLVGLAVWILFIWLCVKKGKEKGYEPWLGLLLGVFLSWIGLIIILVALPDKHAAKPMASMGMPGSMPTAPPMGGMAPPPAPPVAGPPTSAPTPPPPAPPTPPPGV